METIIYNDLKLASLNKDIQRVPTLGPYAFVMGKILNGSMLYKLENDKNLRVDYLQKPLYRGLQIGKKLF